MTFSTGRCPCLVDIDGGVEIAPVGRPALGAHPDPISQGDGMVYLPTHMTALRRGKPAIDMLDHRASGVRHLVQDVHEAGKPQVGDFAAPQRFHALEGERLQTDRVVLGAQLVGQRPVKRLPHMGHPSVDTGQMGCGLAPVVGALVLARQEPIGTRNLSEALPKRLWCVPFAAITARQVGGEPEIKACAFTRHDSGKGPRNNEAGEQDVQLAQGTALDGDRFDAPLDVSGLGELIDRGAEAQAVATQQFPPGLLEGEGFGLPHLAKAWGTNPLRGRARLPILPMLKEALIALVDTFNDLLDGLRTELTPPLIFRQLLSFGNMRFYLMRRKMPLVPAIVAPMYSNAMVMDDTTNVNLLVESSIPLCIV